MISFNDEELFTLLYSIRKLTGFEKNILERKGLSISSIYNKIYSYSEGVYKNYW